MASEIKVDTISEKTSANGVTIDSLSIKDGGLVAAGNIDVNGNNLVLDANANTYLDAGTDDTIKVYVSGAEDLRIAANAINVLSGTTLTIDSGATITNSGTANGFGSADPSSADGDTLGTASAEWSDLYLADGGVIYFGNDQEITLTHNADDGLLLKHVGTGDGKEPSLTFQAGDNDIAQDDVLGSIFFQAPDEGAGTDAVLVAAGIEAVSEGDFSSSNNATKLSFKTAASEAAAEKMSLSSTGVLTTSGDIVAASGSVRNRPNAKPLIINGNMAVAQRSASVASITTSGFYTCDRWNFNISSAGTWTQTQESLTSGDAFTDGFSKSIKVDNTTADASLSAGDYVRITYKFEGQDLQLLKKGTANAEKITVGFWVKATKTGTNILELFDSSNTRQVSQSYTVSSTDTWEYKVVNFPADTTGVITNNNSEQVELAFWLGAGTTFTSGTLNTTWAANTQANRAVGQVNNADSTSNNFEITGVQLEVGEYTSSTIPPFRHESYGENLLRCMRYYEEVKYGMRGNNFNTSGVVGVTAYYKVMKRTTPGVDITTWQTYRLGLGTSHGLINNLDNYFLEQLPTTAAAAYMFDGLAKSDAEL